MRLSSPRNVLNDENEKFMTRKHTEILPKKGHVGIEYKQVEKSESDLNS